MYLLSPKMTNFGSLSRNTFVNDNLLRLRCHHLFEEKIIIMCEKTNDQNTNLKCIFVCKGCYSTTNLRKVSRNQAVKRKSHKQNEKEHNTKFLCTMDLLREYYRCGRSRNNRRLQVVTLSLTHTF